MTTSLESRMLSTQTHYAQEDTQSLIVTAECGCREWPVVLGGQLGRCGLCQERAIVKRAER
jgi:hypothetical protein